MGIRHLIILLLPLISLSSASNDADETGLLIVGGYGATTLAELWAPSGFSCSLPSSDRELFGFTVDWVGGAAIACSIELCSVLTETGWKHQQDLINWRYGHSSQVIDSDRLLILGGIYNTTSTEILSVENGNSVPGFELEEGRNGACAINIQGDTMVLTGGLQPTESLVTELTGIGGEDVIVRELPEMNVKRWNHACGVIEVDGSQILIVAGGNYFTSQLASTELYDYTGGADTWTPGGDLPSHRYGLKGASVGGVFHVTGGAPPLADGEILAWDPITESWNQAGVMTTVRWDHAVTVVPLKELENFCLD